MGVGVAIGTNGFRHRIVGLDEQVPLIVPGECLNAVGHLNVRLGPEVILADPCHFVAVDLHGDHVDLEDGLEHVERVGRRGLEAVLLFGTDRVEHPDLTGADRAPRRHPLVLLPGVPQLGMLRRMR
jgi:hypothetical protein